MSLDDDIKQALHRHESDVRAEPGAWRDVERRITRSHRTRAIASSTLAVAAIAAIAVVVPRLNPSNPAPIVTAPPTDTNQPSPSVSPTQPTTPQLLAKIAVSASRLAAGGDSIWAIDATGDHGTLIRVDGASNEVTARIAIGVKPHAVAATADQVWVANDHNVMRIDPSTNKVVATVDVSVPMDIAIGPDDVWVVQASGTGTTLFRIDPSSNSISAAYPLHPATGLAAVAVGDGYVWVAESDSSHASGSETWRLQRIDPATGEAKTVSFDQFANPMIDVVTSPGAVWVSTTGTTSASAIDRIDSSTMKVVARFELPDASPVGGPNAITIGNGYLWAVGSRGQFWKVDIIKNEPVGNHLNVGEAPPISAPDVVTGFGAVWVASDDGHIWKFAP